jgi:hypothetical protein
MVQTSTDIEVGKDTLHNCGIEFCTKILEKIILEGHPESGSICCCVTTIHYQFINFI